MSEFGYASKSANGYNLSLPPTIEEIDAIQRRMACYTDPTDPRPDRLERLGVSLDRFSLVLFEHPRDYQREANTIRDLANLAFDCANDLRPVN